jgi:hypothetical protein
MTKYDPYTNKKLLINKVEDIFKIDDIEFGRTKERVKHSLKYAILTINGNEYITYSKVILNQLKSGNFNNVEVVLKEHRLSEFDDRKYHKLYIIGELL